ncbi:uncharacterized protein LOC135482756 [Lineus longissimus]|uniref:uncharacterized protein LOC135482756 n=1 Tax=Lineus longissimus TaxID=88925 RepID=UPI002B4DF553
MDVGDSVSEGNEKYSVLLGSALRNNDVDEFFEIYDTNVPKDLTEDQIEHIKEEARKISELAESDYKKRVASTQDYSKGPATMTDQGLSKSAYTANDWKYIDDDDDTSPSGVTGKVPSLDLGSITRHSRHLNNSSTTTSNHVMGNMGKNEFAAALKLHEDEDQNDSGLYFNKTASESTSDTDQNGSDTDSMNRPGMFHYFKPYDNKKTYGSCQPGSNSAVLYHNDSNYDEAFTASDSDVLSPEDSPRETTSMLGLGGRGQMTELKTIRIHKPETIGPVECDEDNDSTDDLTNVNVHKRLYTHIGDFASMNNEDDEIDHSHATSSSWPQKQYPLLGGVGKSFRCYDKGTGSTSDVPRNGPKNNGPRPPFGDPVNVEKIGCSVDDLIPRRGLRDVPDMPASAPITEDRSSEESTKQSEGTKKKKKKKKATKGEVGEGGSMKVGDSVDENGNPIDTQQLRKKDFPNTLSRNFSSRDNSDYRNSTFACQTEDLSKFSNGPWSSSANDDRAEAARKRKAKKSRQESPRKAEDIPDYRGKDKLEDILEFIENSGQGKKKKKAVGPAPPVKPLKDNKKSKFSSPPLGSLDIASDKDDDNEVERMVRDRVRNEPRRLSDLTQKMPLSNHSIRDARKLDKYDLCLPPDIETLIPKEAEFQLVTKSKKKKRPTNSVYPFKDEHFEVPREPRVYKPMRSVTPPPTKTPTDCLATPPSAEKPAERAFSPSAFPVLSSEFESDFPTIRVRRNSTGNAPFEGVTKADDDVAWVEASPPPAGDTDVESNSPVSPRGIVKISYAKIAASPKPKNGVPGAISSTSVVSERRHSFGSMDDANQSIKEAVSSLGNKNDHKSQSQELLSNTGIQDDNDRVTARRNLDSAFQINSTATSAIQSAPPSKMAEPGAGKNTPRVTLPETSQSSNVKPEKASLVASNPVSDQPIHTGPRVPKRPKAKCVIFLDKKINDMPKNLGITFGFDENEAHSQGVSDNITMDPNAPTSKNTCIEGISFKSEPLEQTDGHKLIIPMNGLTLPAQALHMDQNQQIIQLASESNQNRHAPVCSGTISDNGVKCISVTEEKIWEDLAHHESRLGSAAFQYNNEDCVRYLVREWEKVMDARNKGIAIEYHSN